MKLLDGIWLVITLAVCGVASAQTGQTNYQASGSFTTPFNSGTAQGGAAPVRKDTETGYVFYRGSASVKKADGTGMGARVTFTLGGGGRVPENADGEFPLVEGDYNAVVELFESGSWQPISSTARTVKVTFMREGQLVALKANYELTYRFFDTCTGKLLGSEVVPALTTPNLSVKTDWGCDVSWTATLANYSMVGGVLTPTPGIDTMPASGTIGSGQLRRVSTSANTAPNIVGGATSSITDIVAATGGTELLPGLDSPKLADGTMGNVTTGTGDADNATIKKAADYLGAKIAGNANLLSSSLERANQQLKAINDRLSKPLQTSATGSSGGTDMTATNAKLDALNTKTTEVKTAVEAVATQLTDVAVMAAEAKDAQVAGETATTDSAGARSTAQSAAESAAGGRSTTGYGAVGVGSASLLAIAAPGFSLNLDPSADATVGPFLSWLKSLLTFIIYGLFQWWLWAEFRRLQFESGQSQQARGNAVAMGTGAQVTALVAAGIIAGILVGVPVLYWALADAGFSWGGWIANPLASPPSTVAGAAVYLLNCVLPVATILAVLTQMLIVRKGGVVILAGVQAFVRFVVP